MTIVGPLLTIQGFQIIRLASVSYLGVALTGLVLFFYAGGRQKPRLARHILDSQPWRGDEMVLDVGCGRGLWLIAAARHLSTGRAVGVDIWNRRLQSGNSPEVTVRNARLEGVGDKVEVKDGDVRSLPFEDASFDVVIASLVLHHVPGREREKALGELVRVLRHGGRIVMHDFFPEVQRYSRFFLKAGMRTKLSWNRNSSFLGFRTLIASKA